MEGAKGTVVKGGREVEGCGCGGGSVCTTWRPGNGTINDKNMRWICCHNGNGQPMAMLA